MTGAAGALVTLRLGIGLAARLPALVARVRFPARAKPLLGLVCLPAPGVANKPPFAVVPGNGREALAVRRLPVRRSARRSPRYAAGSAVVGRGAPGSGRAPQKSKIRTTPVPPKGRKSRERLSLLASTTCVAKPGPRVHTAVLLAEIPPPVAALLGSSAFRLADVISRVVAGLRRRVLLEPIMPRRAVPSPAVATRRTVFSRRTRRVARTATFGVLLAGIPVGR